MGNYEEELNRYFNEGDDLGQLKYVSKYIFQDTNQFIDQIKAQLNKKRETTLNLRISTKNGKIKLSQDSNFNKILKHLKEFADDYCKEYLLSKGQDVLGVKITLYFTPEKIPEVYDFLRSYQLNVKSIDSVLKSLENQQNKGLSIEKINQLNEFYTLAYEKTASLLEGFAKFVNQKELLFKNKEGLASNNLTNGQIFHVLSNFQNNKYEELFYIFNPTIRNAISHKNVHILDNKKVVIFKDKTKKLEFGFEDYALRMMLSIFFVLAVHIVIGEKFSDIADKQFKPLFKKLQEEGHKIEDILKKGLYNKDLKSLKNGTG